MIEFWVKLEGPGGVINNVAVVVEKSLRDAGFTVVTNNPHPTLISEASHLDFVSKLTEPGLVQLDVCHEPWGG